MPDLRLFITHPRQTEILAKYMLECFARNGEYPALLLQGDLGAGKTTFIRSLVLGLPGAQKAEISSPSFNLINYYPTTPPVSHMDLYRIGETGWDPELEEAILAENRFVLIEWSNYLPDPARPEKFLLLQWNLLPGGREVIVNGSLDLNRTLTCLREQISASDIPIQEME